MNRREFIVASSAAAAFGAMPALSAVAPVAPVAPLEATLFCTTDEPWGVWVPGHVSKERYYEAALRLLAFKIDGNR